MIFLDFLYQTPNLTAGIDDALVDTVASVPLFTPMFLTFVFMVVLISGMNSQRRRSGFADMPLWSTMASVSTLLVALPMTLVSGLINLDILVIVIVVTIASGIWFFMSKSNREI